MTIPITPLAEKNVATVYIGRFAPSPTGPLHFGSLLAAVASFLDARANRGSWLLRMEDLDPPREQAGAADLILRQLNKLSLHWDGEVLYQSSRLDAYEAILQRLQNEGLCYRCDCTRLQIKAMGNSYDGSCRHRVKPPTAKFAIRVKTDSINIGFEDLIQGRYQQPLGNGVGDFVIRRKDKLFAYQLAVVADDERQDITHIIRGFDLIDSTPRQIYLQQVLNYRKIRYGHIPVIVDQFGKKLSKQTFAPSIDTSDASELIYHALEILGLSPPTAMQRECPEHQLLWAIENWTLQTIPKVGSLLSNL